LMEQVRRFTLPQSCIVWMKAMLLCIALLEITALT